MVVVVIGVVADVVVGVVFIGFVIGVVADVVADVVVIDVVAVAVRFPGVIIFSRLQLMSSITNFS